MTPPLTPLANRRFATIRTTVALMLREMVTTNGRSPGGYIWAVLEPVAAIALLSFAFSLAFHAPSLGNSFGLFYATGYLVYMLFHDLANKTATALRFSQSLLTFSAVTWLDAIIARFLLNLLTHLMVTMLVIGSMIILFDTRAAPDLPTAANALGMAASLALGVGLINCYLFMAFPAWERIWMVITRPLFIVSGVFFLFEDLPTWVRQILWFNPVFHATGEMRDGIYPTYAPGYISSPYAYALSLGLILVGLMLMSRHADSLIHK
ncbi:ABC transporter permease [Silicimonas sp. MF1-12-2]|uniref:ABC transporter permease n=1 Tax=Silicimonas sp. MF1-12-2 TaxID=3384793 RepID=UPI0039B5A1F9